VRFDDRVVLITGAGRGIGRGHALYFAERGARIVVNDNGTSHHGGSGHDPAPAEAVVAEIHAAGGSAIAACCDITEADRVVGMIDAAIAEFGRIDAVVHNATVFAPPSDFDNASVADLDRILRVNVHGGWNVLQAAWPHMRRQGHGRIVVTGSGAGFFGRRLDHAYSIAKGALMTMTKLLAIEGAPSGIKANLIGPAAWTENAKDQGMPPLMEKFAPTVLISHIVAALAHEQCPVNGEMFHCGGGFFARVFIGETQGTAFTPEAMTPEAVLGAMKSVLDTRGFIMPTSTDGSTAHLNAGIAAANPEFAAALAAAAARRGS